MPEPEPVHVASVSEHLASCPPCRIEQEALREVDRRLEQLGDHRLSAIAHLRDAARSPSPLSIRHTPPHAIATWRMVFVAMLGVLLLFGTLLLFFRGK